MSISSDRDSVTRLNKAIVDLRSKEAVEIGKEADATKNMNRALEQARKASSPSTAKSYLSTADREAKNVEAAQGRRSSYAKDAASKSKELARLQERISNAEATASKTRTIADERRQREEKQRQITSDRRIRDLESQLAERTNNALAFQPTIAVGETEIHDVFISHAWEDKAEFVDELAAKAGEADLSVWYDTFQIEWGHSLRQEIDRGLAGSYFGVVILSKHFFAKPWPNYELDGLMQKDIDGSGRMLPIWYKLSHDDVKKHSPSLAGRLALNTTMSTDAIVAELVVMRDRFRAKAEIVHGESFKTRGADANLDPSGGVTPL